MSNRPSDKEKFNKVRDALAAVRAGRRGMPLTKHVTEDTAELGVNDQNEYWDLIEKALAEIMVAGPVQTYAGGHPPQKCYESGLTSEELWPYCWDSQILGKKMYLKFVLRDGRYIHINFHADKNQD